jgi:hypothetical protein
MLSTRSITGHDVQIRDASTLKISTIFVKQQGEQLWEGGILSPFNVTLLADVFQQALALRRWGDTDDKLQQRTEQNRESGSLCCIVEPTPTCGRGGTDSSRANTKTA